MDLGEVAGEGEAVVAAERVEGVGLLVWFVFGFGFGLLGGFGSRGAYAKAKVCREVEATALTVTMARRTSMMVVNAVVAGTLCKAVENMWTKG